VFIREIETGFFKISLRSKSYVDVSEVARQFDGGGHIRASGCRYEGNYQDLLDKLLATLEKHL
jgi:phosphoesterase RecJ-like protein